VEAVGAGWLGGGGADQGPAGGEDHAGAVYGDHLVLFLEARAEVVYEGELPRLVHIYAAFGGVEVVGHVAEALGDGKLAVAQDLEEASARVDAVVEVDDGVVEEDVPAELARERGARFEAPGEDVSVAGAPHDWLAAVLLDVLHQGQGALAVE